ncbi:MAG: sensor histidine kinase [Rubrivivax sp.]
MLDVRSFLVATAILYVATPVTVWLLLRRRYSPLAVGLWSLSGLLVAAGVLLFGLQDTLPYFASYQLSNALGCTAVALKVGVLRREAQPVAVGWPLIVAACAAGNALILLLPQRLDPGDADALTNLLLGLWTLAGWHAARRLGALLDSRSARVIALLSAIMAAAMLLRAAAFAIWGHAMPIVTWNALAMLFSACGNVAALGSSVAFIGLALDRLNLQSVGQQQTLEALREADAAKEAASRTRAAVASERARTTRLLADEVRQPLHNAAVALQMGATTLAHSRDPADAAHAIGQAQAVLRRISATLDNTVAVATQLVSSGRVGTAETDLQMLVELCLGDLAPETRERVQLDYRADARSAMLEPTLVRLAMRNLLTNALQHSPPDAPVQLRVLDSDDPLALVIEVSDQGSGIPDALRRRIVADSTPGGPPPTVPGDGLGLHVVKRVARLHGGSIEWRPNRPYGSVFRLTLPQGDPG